jgi:signal transduction histidine kinase/ligand-binding sensor domain-containing protein
MSCNRRPTTHLAGLLLGALVAIQPARALALDPAKRITQYQLDTWLTRNGLPQNSVNAIVQTRDGYLWLGTWGGLARFDGVRFTTFNRANTPGLVDSRITALAETADGSLWIGTAAGGLVRLKDGVFQTFRSGNDTSYEERSRWQIRAITPGRGGVLWIGTSGGGFRRFQDGRFGPLLFDRHIVRTILEDQSGRLWLGTEDGALEVSWVTPDAFEIRRHLLTGRHVLAIHQDRTGTVWIAGRDGLTRVTTGGVTTFGSEAGFSAGAQSISEDRDGNLWIGTNGNGLVRMRGEQFDVLTVGDGLSNGFIHALYEDREGSLWIGSNDGLNRLHDTRFTAITVREGLSADAIVSLAAARDGTVWIGTEGGGLNRLSGGRIETYTTASGLPSNYLGALYEASDGSLWVSGDGVVTRLNGRRLRVYTAAQGVPGGFVSTIGEDRDGHLLIGGEGPVRVLTNDRFVVYDRQPPRIEYCYSMTRDRRGHLWFATTGGLVRVSEAGYRVYTTRDGLPDNRVQSVYEDRSGTLWVATVSGLASIREKSIVSFGKAGALGEIVFEVLEDDAGDLWMNGRQGVLRVRRRDLEEYASKGRSAIPLNVYGIEDGLKSTEYIAAYIQRAACRTRDGRLWFATTRGVAWIDPAVDRVNPIKPPVIVEGFVADERFHARGPVEVAAGVRSFQIRFTALSLLAPSRVRFAYQLENLDPRWIDGGSERVVSYSGVPPGQYRFHVRAANNDGVWNETGATLDISVLPYFYQTVWFRASGAAALVLVAFGLHRLRVRRVEAQFSAVMKERNRMAREIHDTLAQGLAAIGLNLSAIEAEPSEQRREQHLQKARGLVETTLNEAHRSIWDLFPRHLERNDLMAGLAGLARDIGEHTNVHIDLCTAGQVRGLSELAHRNLFRIAQEAVANAIRHANAEQIQIRLDFGLDAVQLTIMDDGRGFDQEAASQGFGLESMRDRAVEIGGTLRVVSHPSTGTDVTATIPLARGAHRRIGRASIPAMRRAGRRVVQFPETARSRLAALRARARKWLSRDARV